MTDREMLSKLVDTANNFRHTAIVDDDFCKARDEFDKALQVAHSYLHKPYPAVPITPSLQFPAKVRTELERARAKHPKPFNSSHEGLAIIREEYLELEHEVFHGTSDDPRYDEAVQLAAMCQRFVEDTIL